MNHEPARIRNKEDLYAAMYQLKGRIKKREQKLEQAWQQLPQETIKATIGVVLPIFLNNQMAGGAWKFLKTLLGILTGAEGTAKGAGWAGSLLSGARQLGLFSLLRLLFGFFTGKKGGNVGKI